jgi:hypothetical protein
MLLLLHTFSRPSFYYHIAFNIYSLHHGVYCYSLVDVHVFHYDVSCHIIFGVHSLHHGSFHCILFEAELFHHGVFDNCFAFLCDVLDSVAFSNENLFTLLIVS